jgi:hypothetical protein
MLQQPAARLRVAQRIPSDLVNVCFMPCVAIGGTKFVVWDACHWEFTEKPPGHGSSFPAFSGAA